MNALILGGAHPRHKAWVREVAAELRPRFEQVEFIDWEHWDRPDAVGPLNEELEIKKIMEVVAGFHGPYVTVDKSIGGPMEIVSVISGVRPPVRDILLGFPLRDLHGELAEKVIRGLASLPEAIFVQNVNDPHGTYDEIADYLEHFLPGR